MSIENTFGINSKLLERFPTEIVKQKLHVYKSGLINKIKIAICKLISLTNDDYTIIPILKFKKTKENETKVSYATKEKVVSYVLNKIRTDLNAIGFQAPTNLEEDMLKQITTKKEFNVEGFIGRYTGTAHALKILVLEKRYEEFCKATEIEEDWPMFYTLYRELNEYHSELNEQNNVSIEDLWTGISTGVYDKIGSLEEYLDKVSQYECSQLINSPQYSFDPDTQQVISIPPS